MSPVPRLLDDETLARARRRSDEACRDESTTTFYWLAQDAARLLDHIEALSLQRDAYRGYAVHLPSCRRRDWTLGPGAKSGPCTCGLDDVSPARGDMRVSPTGTVTPDSSTKGQAT